MVKRERNEHEWAIMSKMVNTASGVGRVYAAPLPMGSRSAFGRRVYAERVGVQLESGMLRWFEREDVTEVA